MRFFLFFWLFFLAPFASAAQQSEIENVISEQFDAFRSDDFPRAYALASPAIRDIFGSVEQFERMVRQGYPMVYRAEDVSYLALQEIAGRFWQRVQIRDRQGVFHLLDYNMRYTREGWRINGVRLVREPQIGA